MKNILWIAGCLVLLISCTKNFEEINTNPNQPVDVRPNLLLRQVIYNYGEEMSYEGFVAGNLLAQHFTMVDFNLFDRHNLSSPQLGGNPWRILYKNLINTELLLEKALNDPASKVYEGPALILKAYITATLTDIYGDVPYFNALKGLSGNVKPSYDSQELIYTAENGILSNLDNGIKAIDDYNGAVKLEGDLFYNGDLSKWIQLANSLKIKYLIRISNIVNIADELQEIYSQNKFIAQNNDNAVFSFSANRPNSFRMQQLRDGDFNLFVLSKTMEEILNNYEDNRITVFFRPTGNNSNVYQGLLNGPDASQTSISINNYSLTGQIFREQTQLLKANFITAWETHFLLAEAAEKGWINGNAQFHYKTAVNLAFEYWNTIIPNNYLSSGNASFGINGADKIEQIITQKWIANTINGYEGWIEYRRTGFPKLKTVSGSLNNNLIPTKMPYPADESALNSSNFLQVTGANGNSINTKVWWDNN